MGPCLGEHGKALKILDASFAIELQWGRVRGNTESDPVWLCKSWETAKRGHSEYPPGIPSIRQQPRRIFWMSPFANLQPNTCSALAAKAANNDRQIILLHPTLPIPIIHQSIDEGKIILTFDKYRQ